MNAHAQQVKSQMAQLLAAGGSRVIGALMFWSLSRVRLRREAVREAFSGLGLAAAVPRDPGPEALARKAAQAAQRGRPEVLIRPVVRDHEKVVYAIVHEQRDEASVELRYQQANRIAFRRDGTVVTEFEGDPVAEAMVQAYVEHRDYADAAELSHMMIAALLGTHTAPMLQAISLRQAQGGLYFLPAQSVEQARALGAWIESVSDSDISILTLTADAENLQHAARAARRSFAVRYQELMDEIRDFVRQQGAGEELSERSVRIRTERLGRLRDQAELYRELLGDMRQRLADQIARAQAALVGGGEELLDERIWDLES